MRQAVNRTLPSSSVSSSRSVRVGALGRVYIEEPPSRHSFETLLITMEPRGIGVSAIRLVINHIQSQESIRRYFFSSHTLSQPLLKHRGGEEMGITSRPGHLTESCSTGTKIMLFQTHNHTYRWWDTISELCRYENYTAGSACAATVSPVLRNCLLKMPASYRHLLKTIFPAAALPTRNHPAHSQLMGQLVLFHPMYLLRVPTLGSHSNTGFSQCVNMWVFLN